MRISARRRQALAREAKTPPRGASCRPARTPRRFGALVFSLVLWGAHCLAATEERDPKISTPQRPGPNSEPTVEWVPVDVPSRSGTGFTRLAPTETGLMFTNRLSDRAVAGNRLLEIGSGVALGDVDGDGWVDVYLCGLETGNALYRNLGGWKFQDITESAGVGCPSQWSTGAVLADLDGDGDLDLLVNALGGGTRAFANNGRGRFTEVREAGFASFLGATSFALADIDGDGDLDVYVTNYRTDTYFDAPRGSRLEMRTRPDGTRVAEPAVRFATLTGRNGVPTVVERGEPDLLYVNRGGGRFEALHWLGGAAFLDPGGKPLTEPPTDWGLAAIFRDFNQDGRPDLYVCNDFIFWPDRLWLNEEGKRFRAVGPHALRQVSVSSMAIDVADINRDGFDDFFTADMRSARRVQRAWQRPDLLQGVIDWPVEDPDFCPEVPRNTLQLSRGDGTFADIAILAGVAATDWTPSAAFLDVDLDGWEDLLVATGNLHDVQDLDALTRVDSAGPTASTDTRLRNLGQLPSRAAAAAAFRNRHDLTFERMGREWGFADVGIAHGMALGDLDNDGDLDVVVNAMNEPARVYRNEASAPRLGVRLRGAGGNTRGIGARIQVTGGPVTQTQEIMAGGRYASSDDPMRAFATGAAREVDLQVTWRSGRRSRVRRAIPNRIYLVHESEADPTADLANRASEGPAAKTGRPLFGGEGFQLEHRHADDPDRDFQTQPLLPRKLANLGPGVAVVDWDGDGDDDLVIGGGQSGRAAFERNDGKGRFSEWTNAPVAVSNRLDQTGVVAWREAGGNIRVAIAESNWEQPLARTEALQIHALISAAAEHLPSVSEQALASGPVATADLEADGDLDLFLGARTQAGRYPESAASRLWIREGDRYRVDPDFHCEGLVSGAVFTDYDGDGHPDLVVAGEWSSLRLWRNQAGRFEEVTEAAGLASYRGWWNGVAVGDFDRDGRLDLVASNWGRNWRPDQDASTPSPVRLYFGDWAGDGVLQTLLASLDPELGKFTPWRERQAISSAIPDVVSRFPTHHQFGFAGVEEILGTRASRPRYLEANTFDSMVFLNRGERFEARPLPAEAQFSPAFGLAVADFDGDGREDVFLSQNFFGVDAESSRQDAGVGLVLLGDGAGGFRALGPIESGIALYGEQRGCAIGDFDADGRPDLAVASHRGDTRVYRNLRARPGVRVAVSSRRGDADVFGVSLRLRCGGVWGAARELHGGGGYWSQDSTTQVLAVPGAPEVLQIRWPGGGTRDWPWPKGAKQVHVTPELLVSVPTPAVGGGGEAR